MGKPRAPQHGTTLLLAVALALIGAGYGFYAAIERSPPPAFHLLATVVPGGLFALWVSQDCRRHSFSAGIDQGYWFIFAWQLLVPYYLFRTRGPRGGFAAVLGFGALLILAIAVGGVVYLVAGGR